MGRHKEKPKLNFQPTTQDYFFAIASMPNWVKIFHKENKEKPYNDFIKFLINKMFYENEVNVTITKISKESSYPITKVKKWLKEIYDGILIINDEKPELFYKISEIKVLLTCSYFDEYCYMNISLPVLPRIGDTFRLPFVKAKVGTDYFFVNKIYHEFENDKMQTTVALKGGIYNQYRDFALAKAEFEGKIGILDQMNLLDMQIDEILLGRSLYLKDKQF